jgi:hypothetical protein
LASNKQVNKPLKKPVGMIIYSLGDLPDSNAYIRMSGGVWKVHPRYEESFINWMYQSGYEVNKIEPECRPNCAMPWYLK